MPLMSIRIACCPWPVTPGVVELGPKDDPAALNPPPPPTVPPPPTLGELPPLSKRVCAIAEIWTAPAAATAAAAAHAM